LADELVGLTLGSSDQFQVVDVETHTFLELLRIVRVVADLRDEVVVCQVVVILQLVLKGRQGYR